jgi:hypothetical protein
MVTDRAVFVRRRWLDRTAPVTDRLFGRTRAGLRARRTECRGCNLRSLSENGSKNHDPCRPGRRAERKDFARLSGVDVSGSKLFSLPTLLLLREEMRSDELFSLATASPVLRKQSACQSRVLGTLARR